MSTPLTAAGSRTIGALKVYSNEAGTFAERDVRLLEMLARPAAVMLANVQARDAAQRASARMSQAIADRDTIRMATGILMEREHLDPDEALSRIMSLSRLEQRALRDVAQEIVAGRTVL
jgi:AmiR/NasT family two-component response regulator